MTLSFLAFVNEVGDAYSDDEHRYDECGVQQNQPGDAQQAYATGGLEQQADNSTGQQGTRDSAQTALLCWVGIGSVLRRHLVKLLQTACPLNDLQALPNTDPRTD